MYSHTKYVYAFDIGGTNSRIAVVDQEGKILKSLVKAVLVDRGPEEFLQQLADSIEKMKIWYPEPEALGISSAGPLDLQNGTVVDSTNLKYNNGENWGIVPIVNYLQSRINVPVFLENDGAAALLGEMWQGAAQDYQDVLLLQLGTGLGTAVVINKELLRAGNGRHTEGGHFPLDFLSDVQCGCGRYGCAETWVSGNWFARRFNIAHDTDYTSEQIAERARVGDKMAIESFDLLGRALAATIRGFTVLCSPEVVLIGGGFGCGTYDCYKESLGHYLNAEFFGQWKNQKPKIKLTSLDEPGLVGAAYVAFRELGFKI